MGKETPRTLKGFRDFLPAEKAARDQVERLVIEVFERFGFQPVETPTLEYAALILGKYGEDADRLVYSFEDRGGRRVALPYDQTVPSARVLTQHRQELPRFFRRYAIRNVFRAENPQKGRYREFKQCDIDIFGSTSPLADAEVVACTYFSFAAVGYPEVRIHLNDRRQLVDALQPFGALIQEKNPGAPAEEAVFSIIRTVDKLDKLDEDRVLAELVEKGLEQTEAGRALEVLRQAKPSENLAALLAAARDLGVPADSLQFSPMLARGLDYYTGAIFEVSVPGFSSGSLAGGGRYDGLIEALGGPPTPAVGIAFGFDRMVEAARALDLAPAGARAAEVLVTVFSDETASGSLQAAGLLRAAGIRCEVHPQAEKLGKQFKLADQKGIPLVVLVGPDEHAAGNVTLRELASGEQQTVPAADLPARVRNLLPGD